MAKNARVRMLRHVLGEKKHPETGEPETLTRDSVVDVNENFAAELVGSKAAEYVEDKTKLSTAEIAHVPEPPAPPSVADGLAAAIAAGVAHALAGAKSKKADS